MADDDLCYLTIARARRLLQQRALSPVELVDAALARIGALDGRVRAFLSVDPDGARDRARDAEHALAAGGTRGPLLGIPLAIKDIVDVAGMPTTAGSRALQGNVATTDAPLVARLRAAGAIVLGKTNTHEFAYGVITAPTRNPWDLARIPGGSSGGSAAALAAGMALGAVGTDTAGSIRLPSALCGVVGLKPTYGLVDTRGVIPLSWSLDHAGPMARSVADVALLLAILAGTDAAQPASRTDLAAVADGQEARLHGLRIGVPRPYFFADLEPAVAAATDEALRALVDAGAQLRELALPDVELTFAVGRGVQRPEASAYHRDRLRATPELYGEEVRRDLEVGALYLATDYIQAQRVRTVLRARWLEAMRGADADLLATPTVPVAALPVEEAVSSGGIKGTLLRNTYPFNLVGFPALSVPCGFTPRGLPVGLQLVGRPDGDATVLRAGLALERATPWHQRRPLQG